MKSANSKINSRADLPKNPLENMSENLSETKHNSKIARLFHAFLRLSLSDKSAQVVKIIFALLIGLKCFSLIGLYFQKSYWVAYHRPDCVDISSFWMTANILREHKGQHLYNYSFQKKYYQNLYKNYVSKFRMSKPNKPTYINETEYYALTRDFFKNDIKPPLYYYYAPNTLWFVYLFSFMAIAQSQVFIGILGLFSVLTAVFWVIKHFLKTSSNFWDYLFLFGIGIVCFPPFRFILSNAQFSLIISICFFFYYYFQKKKNFLLSGLFLSLCFFKPQMGLPLLLLPLIKKEWQTLIACAVFLIAQLLIGYFFIGSEGYISYIQSTFQLMGIQDLGLFVPQPGSPTYPINSIISILYNQTEYCQMNMKNIFSLGNKVFSFTVLTVIFLLARKCHNATIQQSSSTNKLLQESNSVENKNTFDFLQIALIIISSLLLIPYHHIYDYSILISICLIAFDFAEKWFCKAIIWFTFICSLGSMLLTLFTKHFSVIDTYDSASVFWLWIICLVTFAYLVVSITFNKRDKNQN
jgi:hypothetical protein